jgi:glutathione synthase/RimK-type ligase-like ATP-grasp enzyme
MNIAIIGSRHFGNKNDPAIIAANLGTTLYYWEDLLLDIKPSDVKIFAGNENILETGFDLFICLGWYKNGNNSIYRDLALALALALDKKGIKYWNSEMGRQRSTSKLSQMVILALNGYLIPDTLFSLSPAQTLARLTDGTPYIVKAASASRGANNFRLTSKAEIAHVLSAPVAHFLVQSFIANDHDLRVICFAGEPRLILKRSRASDTTHLNNTSQGGSGEWLPLSDFSDEFNATCTEIAALLGREMGGIDFIETIDNNIKKYYCLEVNAIPQLTSGTDVERKMTALKQAIANSK